MTRDESRTLAITAALLFLAGAMRAGLEAVRPPPALEADTASVEELATESQSLLEEEERRSAPLAPGERINPNTAGEVELDRLPGIGPSGAGAIVASREAHGPFPDAASLERVQGIGPATLRRLEPHLAFGPEARRRRAPSSGMPAAGREGTRAAAREDAPLLDLNRATREELDGLPGIGPALAARIIARRNRVGGFRRVEDLIEVPGIGPAKLEAVRVRLFVR